MKSLHERRRWGSSAFFSGAIIISARLILQNYEGRGLEQYFTGDRAQATPHFDKYALHLLMQERRLTYVNGSTALRFGLIYNIFNT